MRKQIIQKYLTQHPNCQEDASKHKQHKKSERKSSYNETAKCYQRHALYFYAKWKEVEEGNLTIIEESSLNDVKFEIGQGCFGVCLLAKYSTQWVILKQQDNKAASKHEARMMANLATRIIRCN